MAPVLQEVLAANEAYAASFGDKGKLAMPPARRTSSRSVRATRRRSPR